MSDNSFTVESWNNVNFFDKRLWILSRTGISSFDGKIFETLSGTYRYSNQIMLDFTWFNIIKGKSFLAKDNLQVLAGYRFKDIFVLNSGYRIRGNNKTPIINLRIMLFDGWQWLQFRYELKTNQFTVTLFAQGNQLFHSKKQ